MPLLLFGALGAQAAAFAVTSSVGDPVFSVLVHGALLAGLFASLVSLSRPAGSERPVRLEWIAYVVIIGALALFATRGAGLSLAEALYPTKALADSNLLVASLLVWVMGGFSFLQHRRRNLVFMSACGLSLFGLVGVVNLEAGITIAFLIFLFSTVVAWSYETLSGRLGENASVEWRRLVRGQAIQAAGVLATVGLAAFLVSAALYWAVPSPFGSTSRFHPVWNWAGALVQGNFLATRQLAVGAGPANLTDDVLFRVRSDYPTLWRTQVYDQYDGRSWARSHESWTQIASLDRANFRLPWTPPADARYNRQQVQVENSATGMVICGTYPLQVTFQRHAWEARSGILRVDRFACLTTSPVSQPGAQYEVLSVLPEDDPARLRAAGTKYPADLDEECLLVPGDVEEALRPLALEITAGLRTPYDKAVAIQSYLEANYYYTEDEPVTPYDKDAAAYFLLETKRGACDLFATSLVVLLRLSGVPARVASGFSEGEPDPESGMQIIRGKDAHAWAEVYFPRYGWIPFNPAPQRQLERDTLWSLLTKGQGRYAVLRIAKAAGMILLAGAALALLLMAVVDPRLVRARWIEVRRGRDPWDRAARECQAAARQMATAVGLTVPRGATPRDLLEAAATVEAAPGAVLRQRLQKLTGELYRLRYSAGSPPVEQVLGLAREFRALRKRLPRRRR
jgi:transglutaminase-like putative cysteine protease